MAGRYLETMITTDVLKAQEHAYGESQEVRGTPTRDALGPSEAAFLAARDSFFMATVNADGWPYLQHRGGPAGFLKQLDEHTVAFADLRGNGQLLSTGNVAGNDRVALFLIDYPSRTRLKLMGRARVVDARDDAALADRLAPTPALRTKVERCFVIDVLSFDWNCPAWITPRWTRTEVEELVAPLRARIAELEARPAPGPRPADHPGISDAS